METYPEYPDWSDKTFLIAEDIDSNYTILAALLKKTHVRILRARNGKEAIQIASGTASIDLILMDISMPDSDGIEALRFIRQQLPGKIVIAQTAHDLSSLEIINEKLRLARRDQSAMMRQLMNADGNDVDDTSPTYKALEEGSASQSKEDLVQMANRQQKFIQGLEAALVRIENKTYGIDRITGELIPKERLRAVPHATLSVASKNARKK